MLTHIREPELHDFNMENAHMPTEKDLIEQIEHLRSSHIVTRNASIEACIQIVKSKGATTRDHFDNRTDNVDSFCEEIAEDLRKLKS